MEVLITLHKKIQKDQNEQENLAWLVIRTTDERNGYIENVLDVDININYLQNLQSHQKIMKNGKSK